MRALAAAPALLFVVVLSSCLRLAAAAAPPPPVADTEFCARGSGRQQSAGAPGLAAQAQGPGPEVGSVVWPAVLLLN